MASPVPTGVSRPSNSPPNFNPNAQRSPDSLADNMNNLQINRPPALANSSGPRPPPFGQPLFPPSAPSIPIPSAFPGASPISRPGPPPASFPRAGIPPTGPPQATLAPNFASGRPSGPPIAQPPPFGSRPPPPGAFPSAPLATGPVAPPSSAQGPISNGPPPFMSGSLPGGFRSPSVGSAQQRPVGPPPAMMSSRVQQDLGMQPFPQSSAASSQSGPPSQLAPPFSVASQGMPPPSASPYGSQTWQMQPRQVRLFEHPHFLYVAPPFPGMQPPRMFGMPPPPPNQSVTAVPPAMGHWPVAGAPVAGPSKIDPNQIPRPIPSSSAILYETRQGNQINPPPPATSDYIVKDTGNCSPRYMRCTINQIPCTGDLLATSSMPLALMVQPLALPHPSEEPIQVIHSFLSFTIFVDLYVRKRGRNDLIVDFGENGPVRCSRCKGYINPFMKFIDQGRRFICNLCGQYQ
ncbi:hypothetical protein HHK36_008961 [Tetracentron sinense]|uniref:Zinc finger Sec23/Sec24-type domain-containing protein n=1 Tax=Tetracentron sinense TaxID=13715 RepID=A0A834ZAX7_TETSI|nr:hypothetical protein HHK36_008961 [Tetracentron sinense]